MRILIVALLALFLAGCNEWFSSKCDAECVASLVETSCDVVPSVADIATVMQIPGAPAGKMLASYICAQWKGRQASVTPAFTLAQASDQCVAIMDGKCCIAVVEGVCIEKAD